MTVCTYSNYRQSLQGMNRGPTKELNCILCDILEITMMEFLRAYELDRRAVSSLAASQSRLGPRLPTS